MGHEPIIIANERRPLLTIMANKLTIIDNSLQTSVRAQIHCKCVQHTHAVASNESLIFYTSILSHFDALFYPV